MRVPPLLPVIILAVIAMLMVFTIIQNSKAATLTKCSFGQFAGEVLPVPSANYLKWQVITSGTTAPVTQTVPRVAGKIMWSMQTGFDNWRQCYASTNTDPCGAAAPTTSSETTNWEPNPVARRLDFISGTTTNDLPAVVKVQPFTTSVTVVGGSYCYE